MMTFDSQIEEAMKPECTSSLEGRVMSAEQLKREESSIEASSCQIATKLISQRGDLLAARILVQMANEDSALLRRRLALHGVKRKGKPRMRWGVKGGRIGGDDSHLEVARKQANFVATRQQATVRGDMNAADSVVLALSAVPCSGKRKQKKMNISLALSSPGPEHMNCRVSEDKDNTVYEEGGVSDGRELTKRWGNNHQMSSEACIVDHHCKLGVLREEIVHVAGPGNISRHMKNDIREEECDDLHETWQVLDGHETIDKWETNDQKSVGAAFEDHHDRIGMISTWRRKQVARSNFETGIEDVAVSVKMPFRLAVPTVERLHPAESPPAPPLASMEPTLNEERFKGMKCRTNVATFSPSSKEVRAYFHKEEALRYFAPDRGFRYTALDGRKSAVAPVRKKSNTRLNLTMLKADRPLVVSIYCLVRDAAARLPGGRGTRADICTLMRDSQYLLEDVTDEQLHHIASKGLDKLHYEVDPCVKYDGKVWLYLHRNRGEEDFAEDASFWTVYLRRK